MRAGTQPIYAAALIAPVHGLRALEQAAATTGSMHLDTRQLMILCALVLPWAWLAVLDRWFRRKR